MGQVDQAADAFYELDVAKRAKESGYASSDIKTKDLTELGDDPMTPDFANAYYSRLTRLSNLLNLHIPATLPEAKAVRYRLMNESGLAGGETNFSHNPYEWMDNKVSVESPSKTLFTERYDSGPKAGKLKVPLGSQSVTQGAVNPSNPERVFINPYKSADIPTGIVPRVVPASAASILTHEAGSHTPEMRLWNQLSQKVLGGDYSAKTLNVYNDWAPKFHNKFMEDLKGIREKGPFRGSHGFGEPGVYTETMAFLMGREAELPAGKTLKTDVGLEPIWARYPGMYEEYTRSKDYLRKQYGGTRR